MSGNDAAGAVIALMFGGVVMLLLAQELSSGMFDFGVWGILYLLAGLGLGIVGIVGWVLALLQ